MCFWPAAPKDAPSPADDSPRSSGAGFRGAASREPFVTFTLMTDSSGIDFVHDSGTSAEKPFPAANGSGVAALDFDGDGWCDLHFASGTDFPIDLNRAQPRDQCYRNLGDWQFEDVTDQCGLGHTGYSAGLAVGDFDNDGFSDLYVNCVGQNQLFRNLGDGTFENVTEHAGVGDRRWGTSAAFLDADGDGHLDLYCCNYAVWDFENNRFCGDRERGVRIFCHPSSVPPAGDVFFLSNGDGTFRDATGESGVGARAGRAQGVVAADIDGDRRTDLYVGNDLNPNSLFVNSGGGHFSDATETSGVGYDWQGRSQAGMGVAAADINGNGQLDLLVTNFEQDHNTLYLGIGDGLFEDSSDRLGVASPGLPWVGWGTAFADFDGNGWPDLIITNGHVDDNLPELGQDRPYKHPPLMLKNKHGRFSDVSNSSGEYFQSRHPGRGLAVADLDNDGDPDVVITHQNSSPAVLRNDALTCDVAPQLRLRLVGRVSNRDAIGATVIHELPGRSSMQQIIGGGSYLSGSATTLLITPASEVSVRVRWPSGESTQVNELFDDRLNVVVESRP